MKAPLLLSVLITLTIGSPLGALTVNGVFGDGAVLQRDQKTPIWGTASPKAPVIVRFGPQNHRVLADQEGNWRVDLGPHPAESRGRPLVILTGDQQIEFTDIVVGDVWLASGQSNMQWTLSASARRLPEVAAVMNAKESLGIRMLRIGAPDTPKPQSDLDRKKWTWKKDSPEVRKGQSAVAFFFARRLHQELNVPIGIIETSWGGKPIEGFIPAEQFDKQDSLKPIRQLAAANKLDELKQLKGGVWVRNTAGLPGRIFNARIAPVAPYALRGFIWYQGESNAGTAEDPRNYRHKMAALAQGWRQQWNSPTLPLYFVQLPSFRNEFDGWVRLREEQRRSLVIKHSGMAVAIDLKDHDIHPANKIDVGERLARWPLHHLHGQKGLVPSGPLFRSAKVEGNTVRVQFDHLGGGLMIASKEGLKSPKETPARDLNHFELADASGKWHPALAEIESQEVVVTAKNVPKPVAVRYACSGAPTDPNLYNRAGLPASPFCSDLKYLPWVSPDMKK